MAFGSELEQSRMRQCNYFLFSRTVARRHEEFDVDRIRMSDRNGGLKPPELHFPGASERIRASGKQATFVTHDPMLTRSRKSRFNEP